MVSLTNTLNGEQSETINGYFEQKLGLSLLTLEERIAEKKKLDENFKQAFETSPGLCVKQIIESETGNTLPEDFLSEFGQGVQTFQEECSGELTDEDLDNVAGGSIIVLGTIAVATLVKVVVASAAAGVVAGVVASALKD